MSTKSKKRPTGKRPANTKPAAKNPSPKTTPDPTPTKPNEPTRRTLADHGNALFPWVICLFFGFAHTAIASRASFYGGTADAFTVLLIPIVVTFVLVPGSRRRGWHRWFVALVIPFIVVGSFAAVTLAIAETWIFHQFWVVENPDNHIKRWLRRRSAARTTTTP